MEEVEKGKQYTYIGNSNLVLQSSERSKETGPSSDVFSLTSKYSTKTLAQVCFLFCHVRWALVALREICRVCSPTISLHLFCVMLRTAQQFGDRAQRVRLTKEEEEKKKKKDAERLKKKRGFVVMPRGGFSHAPVY
jgi:hypothetical protein